MVLKNFFCFLLKVLKFYLLLLVCDPFWVDLCKRFRERFNFLLIDFQLFQHHLLKKLYISFIELHLHLCKKSPGYTSVGQFLGSLLCSMISAYIPLPITHNLGYYNYILSSKIRCSDSSYIIFLFKVVFQNCFFFFFAFTCKM